jgi:hypothetical protein
VTGALEIRQAAFPRRRYARTRAIAAAIVEIVDEYSPQTMSTRQIFYQLVSRGVIVNDQASYDRTQRITVELRRDGIVEYSRIVDRRRMKHHKEGWDGADELIAACAHHFRRDVWASQDTVVMIGLEKVALEGVFSEVADEYGASVWPLQGYSSVSFAFEWATEIRRLTDRGKLVAIYYFGDHDPAGLDIERDVRDKLVGHGADFEWERRGLLFSDLDGFDLINVPVKAGDSKSKKYLAQFGNRAAELDALPPDELTDRIRASIAGHVDEDQLRLIRRDEDLQRESLEIVARNWDAAVAGAKEAE